MNDGWILQMMDGWYDYGKTEDGNGVDALFNIQGREEAEKETKMDDSQRLTGDKRERGTVIKETQRLKGTAKVDKQ